MAISYTISPDVALSSPPARRGDIPNGTVTYQGMGGSGQLADAATCRGLCDWAAQPAMALCSRAPAACLASACHESRPLT